MKKVSVIIPVYKCEKYLKKCIDSVLDQTYTEFELILVDDGSPDSSGMICDNYARKNHQIKVIHQKNMGVSVARKKGILISQSDFVTFLDSDDYLEKDFLEVMMRNIEDADVICCNLIDEGIVGQPNICIKETRKLSNFIESIEEYFNGTRFAYIITAKIFKKSLLENIEFPNIKFTEDTHMMLDCFSLSDNIKIIPYQGYHYVAQPESVMTSGSLIDLTMDNLVTAEYLCHLCLQHDCLFLFKAQKILQEKLYNAILALSKLHCQNEKMDMEDYINSLSKYENCLNTQKMDFSVKSIVNSFFMKYPKFVIIVCSYIYRLK